MDKKYDDTFLEEKWRELEDVLIDYDDDSPCGMIADDWFIFEKGTELVDIWTWFNHSHSKGLSSLVYG